LSNEVSRAAEAPPPRTKGRRGGARRPKLLHPKLAARLRFMDYLDEEQRRAITMKPRTGGGGGAGGETVREDAAGGGADGRWRRCGRTRREEAAVREVRRHGR